MRRELRLPLYNWTSAARISTDPYPGRLCKNHARTILGTWESSYDSILERHNSLDGKSKDGYRGIVATVTSTGSCSAETYLNILALIQKKSFVRSSGNGLLLPACNAGCLFADTNAAVLQHHACVLSFVILLVLSCQNPLGCSELSIKVPDFQAGFK